MKKLLTILSLVLLVAAFVAPSQALAQGQPIPITPSDGSQVTVNADKSVTFKWIYAWTTYQVRLQIDDDILFRNPEYDEITPAPITEITIKNLPTGKTLYWRLSAYYWWPGVGILWSDINAATKVDFIISIPALLGPTNGATELSQSLVCSWRAIAGSATQGHQIIIDNNSNFSSLEKNVKTQNSSVAVSGLAYNTTFYWKVRYYSGSTNYTWSSTRSFTTGCDLPGATTLSSPANNAVNQTQPVPLSWAAVGIATKYNFQIALNQSFSPAIVNQDVTPTNYSASGLEPGTKYYWRVRAGNQCGYSSFTGTRNFTTACPAPPTPGLMNPPDGATGVTMPFILDWNDIADADQYRVQVFTDVDFPQVPVLVIDESPSSSQYIVSSGLSPGIRYNWRVSSHTACGSSAWSGYRDFTMECPTPAQTSLELPINGATGLPQPIMLNWASVTGATKYNFEIDDNADFSSAFKSLVILGTSYGASGMADDGRTYYWRVRAGNNCGNWSSWTAPWNFSTECVTAGAPPLVSPADGATGIDIREPVLLDWSDIAGNTGYQVQVDDDDMFGSPVTTNTPTGVSQFNIETGLVSGTDYFWRVRTNNVCGYGGWSSPRAFTPECPAVDVAMLQSPANGTLSVPQPIELDWSDVTEATKYHLQVGSDVGFGYPLVIDEEVVSSAYTLPNLNDGFNYYWRIRSYNGCQWSDWSSSWTFIAGEQTDVGIVANDQIPDDFALKQNYPNPFNPATTIEFALPRAQYVLLEIINILGERVETLVSRPMSAGSYSVTWDASSVPSGIYFYKIIAGTFSETKKMTLIK